MFPSIQRSKTEQKSCMSKPSRTTPWRHRPPAQVIQLTSCGGSAPSSWRRSRCRIVVDVVHLPRSDGVGVGQLVQLLQGQLAAGAVRGDGLQRLALAHQVPLGARACTAAEASGTVRQVASMCGLHGMLASRGGHRMALRWWVARQCCGAQWQWPLLATRAAV